MVPASAIDVAAGRMLEFKFRAGLFDNPYGDKKLAKTVTGNQAARALALKAAEKSLCLLKNDGTLPLKLDGTPTIAVIGPNHAIARLGGYSSVPRQTVSLLEGMQQKIGNRARIVSAQGVFIP